MAKGQVTIEITTNVSSIEIFKKFELPDLFLSLVFRIDLKSFMPTSKRSTGIKNKEYRFPVDSSDVSLVKKAAHTPKPDQSMTTPKHRTNNSFHIDYQFSF